MITSSSNQTFSRSSKSYMVLQRLEYWFKKKPNGFFKFIQPCTLKAYKAGDSWVEELGITRPTFNKAFDQIGTRHRSRTAFLASTDKFKGKMYASYYERRLNKMFFIRNDEVANEFKSNLYSAEKLKVTKALTPSSLDRKNTSEIHEKNTFGNGTFFRSPGGTIGGKINLPSFSYRKKTTLYNSGSIPRKPELNPEHVAVAEEMKRIWLEEVEDFGDAVILPCLTKNLWQAFKDCFQGCWERWRSYCRMIASSKFLMGEGNNKTFKKIWINWAIKAETIQRVIAGGFGLGTRKLSEKEEKKQEEIRIEKQDLLIEKQAIENTMEELRESVDKGRKGKVLRHIESISALEKQSLEVKFMKLLEDTNDPLLKDHGDNLWKVRWTIMRFERFMITELTESLFTQSAEQEYEEKLNSTNLPRMLDEINEKLEIVEEKMNQKPNASQAKPKSVKETAPMLAPEIQPHWV